MQEMLTGGPHLHCVFGCGSMISKGSGVYDVLNCIEREKYINIPSRGEGNAYSEKTTRTITERLLFGAKWREPNVLEVCARRSECMAVRHLCEVYWRELETRY